MADQVIVASPTAISILKSRNAEAERAERVAAEAASVANDLFTLFCETNGLPQGTELVGFQDGAVVVRAPTPTPTT